MTGTFQEFQCHVLRATLPCAYKCVGPFQQAFSSFVSSGVIPLTVGAFGETGKHFDDVLKGFNVIYVAE